ncbi:MAG: 4-alpha-glucanotransferase [Planctomycetota bacterium]|jgi:4-alpha-glucanotransferase
MTFAAEAKRKLGIKRLVLQIHDTSFPARADEDTGRGSPYSWGASDFLKFIQSLGFDGIQFGPQGQTDRGNACPYDGRLFPHDFLSVALKPLVEDDYWEGILSKQTLQRIAEGRPPGTGRSHHRYAWDEVSAALSEAVACFKARGEADGLLDRDFRAFVTDNEDWLPRDFSGGVSLGDAFPQFVLHRQRQALRATFPELRFYGDFQIGINPIDAREFAHLFHPDYAVGAPPSRTNPEGQPWGYAVLHPARIADGSAQQFLRRRVERLLSGLDGIRIDHPHGLVCPWVYRRDQHPASEAVRAGARMYESPSNAAHPQLAKFAIARPDQVDDGVTAYDSNRVTDLDDEQVDRYSVLIDVVLDCIRAAGGDLTSDVACEVLSTLPYPLQRVMERYGLGRFRVVQKAALDKPEDGYRIEHAEPADWIMLGNHDTPPIWLLARGWCAGPRGREWAEYLADRLTIPASDRADFVARTSSEPGELVHALFAAMLASHAGHVTIFFPDLLGLTSFYNRPGVVNETNWTLRVPPTFESDYGADCDNNAALDLTKCFQIAMQARNT